MPEETNSPNNINAVASQPREPFDNYSGSINAQTEMTPYNNTENPRPELAMEPFDKRPLLIGAGVGLAFFVLSIVIGVWLYNNPNAAEVIRDIFIIYIGLGIFVLIPLLIILTVVLTYLVLKLNDLVQLLQKEIAPMLTNVQGSLNTVRGTTSFLSEQAAKPVISTVSMVTAVNTVVRSLFKRN